MWSLDPSDGARLGEEITWSGHEKESLSDLVNTSLKKRRAEDIVTENGRGGAGTLTAIWLSRERCSAGAG